MFDFYLISSAALNIILSLMWRSNDLFNLCIKAFLLLLSITGVLVVINTYHLIH